MNDQAPPLGRRERVQLETVVALVRGTLGDSVLGVWLHGSAVAGGLRPASDLDVLVLSRGRITDGEKRRLVDGLLPISGSRARQGPARSIELSVVAEPDVRPWRYPPRLDLQYGDWLREAFARGDPEPWQNPNPDLAVLLTSARGANRPLLGPALEAVLEPVPKADVARAMTDGLPSLLADLDGDTRNVLLTLARIWVTFATGEIRSKDAAAHWVLARLPERERPALGHARAVYLGEAVEDWWSLDGAVHPVVDRMVAGIRRIAASAT